MTVNQREGGSALFPIVGIGVPAGGLVATLELLRQLGPDPGLAIVIIHDLDPPGQTSVTEIIAQSTELPVEAAADGERVKVNHVYVLPKDVGMIIDRGTLRLTPTAERGARRLRVDRFLESLAADRSTSAIGLLLDGPCLDGTGGIRAIKAEGGITFAVDSGADPANPSEGAAAAGCADFIWPLEKIARELVRIGRHPPAAIALVASPEEEPDFRRVLAAIRRAQGVDLTNYKETTIRRRIQRRIFLHRHHNLHEYAEYLDDNPQEATALCQDVLIQVTSFFRDPELFNALKELVVPKLLENRAPSAPLRFWVPACSTGEEVYSVAMMLLEYLADVGASDVPIRIFGTDVSQDAIDKARAGRYPKSIERDVSQARLGHFFNETDGGYQIRKEVRDLCVFAQHDATRDPPFSGIDLVSCRNLLIYLGPALQDRILGIFHYALKEPGFLALGSAESVRSFPGFACIDAKNKIYARTSAAPRLSFDFAEPRFAGSSPTESTAWVRPSNPLDVHREADRLVLAEYGPPGVVITDDLAIVQFRGKIGPYLEPVPGIATFDLLRMAREELRLPLRQAIDEARATKGAVRKLGLTLGGTSSQRFVEIEIVPFSTSPGSQRHFVVLFKEAAPFAPDAASPASAPATAQASAALRLEQELTSTRAYLESVIERLEASNEELRAANEEVVSSNEELRSTNEELQAAKEELQATNEELRTVNDELAQRNAESTRLSEDLTNVLNSVEIPIVLLGRDSRIRRFTPAAGRLFHLVSGDAGRPIGDFNTIMGAGELARIVSHVLSHLTAVERVVRDEEGRFYQFSVRPYMTLDNRIDGTVIAAFDVDRVKKGEQLLLESRAYAESIIDTVRACLVVLEPDLRVRSVNRSFLETFRLNADQVLGRHFCQIDRGAWDIPDFQARLDSLREGDTLNGFRVEHDFPRIGRRVFLVDSRRIDHTALLLLVLNDETDRDRAERALQRREIDIREMMLMRVNQAIVMIDEVGKVLFANDAAARVFGYQRDEIPGLSVEALVPDRLRERHVLNRQTYLSSPSSRPIALDRDLTGRRKDGTEFPIELVLSVVERDGTKLGVAFVTDITERREAESKIRDYQDKLQRMAFDAALAEERERRRIAGDLHDHIGQALALARMKLSALGEIITGAPRSALEEATRLLEQSAIEARTLTFELSPPVLYDLGLKEALLWLGDELRKRHGIEIEVDDDALPKPLEDTSAALVFRAVRELLMNVLKHAKVFRAGIFLRRTGDQVEIEVCDEGIGFDLDEAAPHAATGGYGLFSVRERIGGLGGTVQVSSKPGHGTRVRLRVPLDHAKTPANVGG